MADESWRPVQELAAGAEELPSQYVQWEQDRPAPLQLAANMSEPLPIVDLRRLPTSADETAKLRSALQAWGLVLVTGHGIEASLMDSVMDASREFFRQPPEEKRKCSSSSSSSSSSLVEKERFEFEGYGSDPVIAQDQILDWNDRLQLQVEPQGDRNLAQWPQHPECFRDLLHQYASKTKTVRDNILQAIAKILELEEDHFITHQMGDRAQAFARFNYYPPCPRPELVLGVKPHSDASVVTVLLVDSDVCGLQIKRDGMWFNVPAIPHMLVVNLGDFMEIMNNGIFKSPVHRVVTTAHKERISLALFYTVERDAVIEPTPRLLDDKRPARYRRVTEKDFLHEKTKEHVSKGLEAIETLKI